MKPGRASRSLRALLWGLPLALVQAAGCQPSRQHPAENARTGGLGGGAGSAFAAGGTSLAAAGELGRAGGESGGGAATGAGGSDGATGGTAGGTGWLTDPGAWDPVATLPACSTFVARHPADIWPGFAYRDCGAGCREAHVVPGDGAGLAVTLGTSARSNGDDLLLSLSLQTSGDQPIYALTTLAFGAETPLALVSERGPCLAQIGGRGAPLVYKIAPFQGKLEYRLGWLDLTAPGLSWLDSTVTTTLETFDFGTSWGRMDARATMLVADTPLSTEVSSIYGAQGTLFDPSGNGGLLAWTEFLGPGGQVLAWKRGQDVTVVAEGSWDATRFGFSSDRFAWIGATGARVSEGSFESARLYSCKVPSPLAACEIEEGPVLPLSSATGILAVAGHYVAFNGCSTAQCDVYIVDWNDQSLYLLSRLNADHGVEMIGLSANELFVADSSPDVRGTGDFDLILRYDLTELESFATRL